MRGEKDMVDITIDLLGKNKQNRPQTKNTMKYLTIHDTGNTSKGANAKANASYIKTIKDLTSWHYTVDDKSIYQHIPDNEKSYSTSSKEANENSIAIELCVNKDGDWEKTKANGIDLIVYLMKKYNIPISNIFTHKYWSGKNCPAKILKEGLDKFIIKIDKSLNGGDGEMKTKKLRGGYMYTIPQSSIEYIGYFYGVNGNENIKNAYSRIAKLKGSTPDFFMNAELFDFKTRKPASDVVSCGSIHRLTEGFGIAFPDNKKSVFSYKNAVKAGDYIGAYPVLVRNSKVENLIPSGIGGSRGRTALGIDNKNNIYVALVPDGSNDVTLETLRKEFINAGSTDAINLDGGGSTQFYAPLSNHFTGRNVRGFIGIWLKHEKDLRKVNVKSSLNVRKGAGILFGIAGKLYNGDIVNVIETKGKWCRIPQGWVSSDYLLKGAK